MHLCIFRLCVLYFKPSFTQNNRLPKMNFNFSLTSGLGPLVRNRSRSESKIWRILFLCWRLSSTVEVLLLLLLFLLLLLLLLFCFYVGGSPPLWRCRQQSTLSAWYGGSSGRCHIWASLHYSCVCVAIFLCLCILCFIIIQNPDTPYMVMPPLLLYLYLYFLYFCIPLISHIWACLSYLSWSYLRTRTESVRIFVTHILAPENGICTIHTWQLHLEHSLWHICTIVWHIHQV